MVDKIRQDLLLYQNISAKQKLDDDLTSVLDRESLSSFCQAFSLDHQSFQTFEVMSVAQLKQIASFSESMYNLFVNLESFHLPNRKIIYFAENSINQIEAWLEKLSELERVHSDYFENLSNKLEHARNIVSSGNILLRNLREPDLREPDSYLFEPSDSQENPPIIQILDGKLKLLEEENRSIDELKEIRLSETEKEVIDTSNVDYLRRELYFSDSGEDKLWNNQIIQHCLVYVVLANILSKLKKSVCLIRNQLVKLYMSETDPDAIKGDFSEEIKNSLAKLISLDQEVYHPEELNLILCPSKNQRDQHEFSIVQILDSIEIYSNLIHLYLCTRKQKTLEILLPIVRAFGSGGVAPSDQAKDLGIKLEGLKEDQELYETLLSLLAITNRPIPKNDFVRVFHELFNVFDPLVSVFLRRVYPIAQFDSQAVAFEKVKSELQQLINLLPVLKPELSSKNDSDPSSKTDIESNTAAQSTNDTPLLASDALKSLVPKLVEVYKLVNSSNSSTSIIRDLEKFREDITSACKRVETDLKCLNSKN
jgi:hypothetical protein